MMSSPVAQAVWLGLIQGLTEFLPVSSSGHLALAQHLIPGFNQPGILLDVLLHTGTLMAVLVYFRRDLIAMAVSLGRALGRSERSESDRELLKLIAGIVIASVPTALIGFLLEKKVEAELGSMAALGVEFMITAGILAGGDLLGKRAAPQPGVPGYGASFLIGMAQGVAVIPAISRSGTTIAAARALGISGENAARFSFLISLPAIGGATLLTVLHEAKAIEAFSSSQIMAYVLGPLCAAGVGYAAIGIMMKVMKQGKLWWFAGYCAALGLVTLGFALAK